MNMRPLTAPKQALGKSIRNAAVLTVLALSLFGCSRNPVIPKDMYNDPAQKDAYSNPHQQGADPADAWVRK